MFRTYVKYKLTLFREYIKNKRTFMRTYLKIYRQTLTQLFAGLTLDRKFDTCIYSFCVHNSRIIAL